jgi:formylglycine-generating enzyme required for sulfatase activity
LSNAGGYRLPYEAEWEWAARGGLSSAGHTYSGSNSLDAVAWFEANSTGALNVFYQGRGSFPVGLKQPNELGIFDMSGNATEWCWDSFGDWKRVRGGHFASGEQECSV